MLSPGGFADDGSSFPPKINAPIQTAASAPHAAGEGQNHVRHAVGATIFSAAPRISARHADGGGRSG